MIIVLIGMRAVGKTTVGRSLADRLSRRFVDLDDAALARFPGAGSVREVWDRHGESAWRAAEAASAGEVLGAGNVAGTGQASADHDQDPVFAIGGGAPVVPAVADALRRARSAGRARVIWLTGDVAVLKSRLGVSAGSTGASHRPSLTGADPLAEIEPVLRAREPVYRGLADHEVDSSRLTADEVVRFIIQNCL